jgi:hypothetical protein
LSAYRAQPSWQNLLLLALLFLCCCCCCCVQLLLCHQDALQHCVHMLLQ